MVLYLHTIHKISLYPFWSQTSTIAYNTYYHTMMYFVLFQFPLKFFSSCHFPPSELLETPLFRALAVSPRNTNRPVKSDTGKIPIPKKLLVTPWYLYLWWCTFFVSWLMLPSVTCNLCTQYVSTCIFGISILAKPRGFQQVVLLWVQPLTAS